jgi:hypothetical protein
MRWPCVFGPVPTGEYVQYDVQFIKEEDEWRIVSLHMVF